jgi:hypothetical protein
VPGHRAIVFDGVELIVAGIGCGRRGQSRIRACRGVKDLDSGIRAADLWPPWWKQNRRHRRLQGLIYVRTLLHNCMCSLWFWTLIGLISFRKLIRGILLWQQMDRSWVYGRPFTPAYLKGVEQFMKHVTERYQEDTEIRCPCRECLNQRMQPVSEVENHVLIYGMSVTYTRWIYHGNLLTLSSWEFRARFRRSR